MGETDENLLKVIRHCQESLDKYTDNRNENKLLHYLSKLYKLPIKVVHLEDTGVGRTVNGLRKLGGDVGDSAKSLVAKWKEMVVGEQEAEEEDDDDDDDEEDDEDGYQSGDNHSDSDSKHKKVKESSSHKKRDNHKGEREKVKDRKRDSVSSDSTKSHRKDSHKHNGHKSHKRRGDSSASEDETPKKKHRKSEEERHKLKRRNDSESEEEPKRSKKHKSRKVEEPPVEETKSKERHKDHSGRHKEKHKSSDREDKKQAKTKEEKKHKDKGKDKSKVKTASVKSKSANGGLPNYGIDSGSGASFAEALGMCEPSSSRGSSKKKTSEKREKPASKTEETVPKLLLKEPTVEPLDINLASLLPSITPNYRPLGSLLASDNQPKKCMSESEALVNSITSKNQRTKVYSGNKVGSSTVPSLFELCIRILQDNIDALEYTGGVPYTVLKPILEKANPNQLYTLEHHNPYLIEDTDELWQLHCQKEFRNKKREELESWREMYLRCLDERDAKLKALTANIKQSQDKSLPVRMTKLAYVDAVAKPPRNIARKQAKNGTAFDVRKPTMTPSLKLNSLATSGEAGKVAVPNPGSRAAERSCTSHNVKPKKAPLMLKSISSFKNRFKR